MSLFHNNGNGISKNDEFYTYAKDWEAIGEWIPNDKVVWEPFSNVENLEGVNHLYTITQELKFATGDFFDNNEGEVVVSNPPFSIKKEILERLKELEKPFILLLPVLTLQNKYFHRIFEGGKDIQVIYPTRKIFFYRYDEKGQKIKVDKLSYYCCYICYKMNLERDVIFLP